MQGTSPESAEYQKDIHDKVHEASRTLLEINGFVLQEEALRRADISLRNRHSIDWKYIRKNLEKDFRRTLLTLSKQNIRDLVGSKFDAPLRLSLRVREQIFRGHGGTAAGYALPNWDKTTAERHALAREHSAKGFNSSATRIRRELNDPPLPLLVSCGG